MYFEAGGDPLQRHPLIQALQRGRLPRLEHIVIEVSDSAAAGGAGYNLPLVLKLVQQLAAVTPVVGGVPKSLVIKYNGEAPSWAPAFYRAGRSSS